MSVVNRDWSPEWTAGTEGAVRIIPPGGFPVIDVVVRAEGFASTLKQFAGDELKRWREGCAIITLTRGENVQVRFKLPDGLTWPVDVIPQFYFDRFQRHVANSRPVVGVAGLASDLNMLGARSIEPGRVSVRLSARSPAFAVGIHAPGFLQFCDVGPFTLADERDGTLEIAVPKPAVLTVQIDPGTTEDDALPYVGARFNVAFRKPGGQSFVAVAEVNLTGPRPELRMADLPQGEYFVNIITQPKSVTTQASPSANPGIFRDSKKIALGMGDYQKLVFQFVPFDPNAFRGDRTAILRFSSFDGSPVGKKEVVIKYYDAHYGALHVYSGELPPSGIVEVPRLTDRRLSGQPTGLYSVALDKQYLDSFSFKKDAGNEEFTFKLPPLAGDLAPEVELTNIVTGQRLKISDLRGKVVCIDFWATWCGPCQQPLEHLNDLSLGKCEAWKDQVVILPISIDDTMESVPGHLSTRGWMNLDHYWTGKTGDVGWKSPAAKAYVITVVPTMLILGRDGKILWRGNSADTNGGTLESRIEAAIGR